MKDKLTQKERSSLLKTIYISQGSCSPQDIKRHFSAALCLVSAKAKPKKSKG